MRHRLRALACSAALLALAAAAPARAQIDLTGSFVLDFSSIPEFCDVTVTQAGSSFQMLLDCIFLDAGAIGTIDPMTGIFAGTGGCTVGPVFGTFHIQGAAAPDSASFLGLATCPPNALPGQHPFTAERVCPPVPAFGCRAAGRSILAIKEEDFATDKLLWKWLKGAATTQEDFGMPTGTTGYTLCIYAGTVASGVARAQVPANPTLWNPISTKGWKYKDKVGAADGVQKVLLKGGAAGKSKVLVKGKGAGLPELAFGTLPVEAAEFPVTVQLLRNATNLCWESTFDAADVKKNSEDDFKAKSESP